MKTTALRLFCKYLLLACHDISSHVSVCQHKGVPHAACWKPETIYICGVSLTTEVTFMKTGVCNSCFTWVVCALGFFQYLILSCWFLLGEAEPHRDEEIWGHTELFLFPGARWVPMIKASSEGDRRPPGHTSLFVTPGCWQRCTLLFLKDVGEGQISKHQMGSCNEKPKGGYTPEVLNFCKTAVSKECSEWGKKVFGSCEGNKVSEQKPTATEG